MPSPVQSYYVITEPTNGLRIDGRRRQLGEKIEMSESAARFLVLDGIVSDKPPAPAAAPKGKNQGEAL